MIGRRSEGKNEIWGLEKDFRAESPNMGAIRGAIIRLTTRVTTRVTIRATRRKTYQYDSRGIRIQTVLFVTHPKTRFELSGICARARAVWV